MIDEPRDMRAATSLDALKYRTKINCMTSMLDDLLLIVFNDSNAIGSPCEISILYTAAKLELPAQLVLALLRPQAIDELCEARR